VSRDRLGRTAAGSAFFDRLAGTWSQAHYGPQGDMVARIARFANALESLVPASASILDYGCGTGDIAAALARRGYRVEARDWSAEMIAQARALHAGSGVRFVAPADAPVLPGDQSFDAVVCSSVLEYLDDLPECLRALAGTLKPGGWLIATVPSIRHPLRRREALHRALMGSALLRALVRLTPRRDTYELQWLSHNRLPLSDWAALFRAAQLRSVWQDCEDHPLALLIGQKGA
jgi:2-polyprenyl-6-hydroxyphenyl methylase/3-demethylubiquinone-9 3-methyltransferase